MFLANTNSVFGIRDLRLTNPLYPDRFVSFIRAAGAKRYALQIYCYDNPLSKLLDLASVKYILSQFPLVSDDEKHMYSYEAPISSSNPVYCKPGLRLESASTAYYPQQAAIFCRVQMKVHQLNGNRCFAQPVLLSDRGDEIWSGDRKRLLTKPDNNHVHDLELCYIVPTSLPSGTKVKVAMRVGYAGGHFIKPKHSPLELRGYNLLISEYRVERLPVVGSERFRFLLETPNRLRVYENKEALPEAYVVHHLKYAASASEVLDLIRADDFDPRREVVLEQRSGNETEAKAESSAEESALVSRPNNNSIRVSVKTSSAGYLVVTDTYYPGWKVFIDGVETPVLRANYMFRAVKIPKGDHIVRFQYIPQPFWIGVCICFAMLLGSGFYFVYSYLKNKNRVG
ncbi:MAG: YfhO family protein [Candidatus Obscuribacterales bacterium]|nr:YfhO family protein [Candidatus Obscuribacterales bacterium]